MTVADSGSVSRTISNDVTDFTLNTPRGVQDITGVDKSAHERLLLLADVSVSLKGVFNSAANLSHAVFSTVPSTAVARATSIAPTSNNGTPILTFNAIYSDYGLTRAAAGELTWQVKGDLSDGSVPTWALCPDLFTTQGAGMGYRRNRKLYDLKYEEFDGLQVMARPVPVGELLDILQLGDALRTAPDREKIEDLFGRFAGRIVSWNYEDEDGKPLDPTLETLRGEDSDFVLKLIAGWVGAITGSADPTKAEGGAAGVEASIPMSSPAGT